MQHTCDVIKIERLEPHPNADSLSIVRIGDYQCVVRTSDWNEGDLAVYIPPDSVVPHTKEFEFLGEKRRIRAVRLRGQWSVGLLIPAPEGSRVGDDCMEQLGIVHYEPEMSSKFTTGGDNMFGPTGFFPTYDVENFRKPSFAGMFQDGEEVIVTEKIHGANARYVCVDDVVHCGSRNNWKKQDQNNLWWKSLANNTVLESWLRHHQGLAVYGEIFGNVQKLKYGASSGEIFFNAFDILRGNKWLDFDEAKEIGDPLPWVPLVYRGPFDKEKILELAEGDSSYCQANHMREGVVVKPVRERTHPKHGRVQLKVVGNRYLGSK